MSPAINPAEFSSPDRIGEIELLEHLCVAGG